MAKRYASPTAARIGATWPDVIPRRILTLAAFITGASCAAAAPMEIAIETPAGAHCLAGRITVTPGPAPSEWRAVGERTIVTIDVAAEESVVTVEAPGCWAPALRVQRGGTPGPLPVRLWRAGKVTGKLALPKDAPRPSTVAVRIESPPSELRGVPRTTIDCPVSAGAEFHCDLPATLLDLRVAVEGLAPRYLWGVVAKRGATVNVGDLSFARGGSISGSIRFDGAGPPLETVVVEVVPTAAPPTTAAAAADEQRLGGRAEKVRPTARGFFQFAHLEPGQYTVTARHVGWSSAREAEIRVTDGVETELSRALVIEPLARVEVFVQPPLDPRGEPWKVALRQMTPLSSASIPIADGPASLTGNWLAEGVEAGVHQVAVTDHRGNSFARSTVDVTPRMPPVQIAITAVAVEGAVTIGDEPVEARLELRNGKGALLRLRTDADGRFSAALPTEGRWDIDLETRGDMRVRRTVSVRRRDDGPTEIDLALPGTRVDVTVVDDRGDPVNATVRALNAEQRIVATGLTGADGRFRFEALEPGEIRLSATTRPRGGESGLVTVEVREESTAAATLIVRPQVAIKGWLVTPSGAPVGGAFIRWRLPHRIEYREDVSGPSGEFQMSLPYDIGTLDLVILPPAMPVKLLSIPVRSGMNPNLEIVVGAPSGLLELEMEKDPPFPVIQRGGIAVGAMMLAYPLNWTSAPRDRKPWGMAITLEAGHYAICSKRGASCKAVNLAPGAVERVDARGLSQ